MNRLRVDLEGVVVCGSCSIIVCGCSNYVSIVCVMIEHMCRVPRHVSCSRICVVFQDMCRVPGCVFSLYGKVVYVRVSESHIFAPPATKRHGEHQLYRV